MLITKNNRVRYQLDIGLADITSLEEAVRSGNEAVTEVKPVAVLSFMGDLYELNLTSALFWEAIESPAQINDIAKNIASIFEVDNEVLLNDLTELVDEFRNAGLVNVG